MSEPSNTSNNDDGDVISLLHEIGRRDHPSPEVTAYVRQAAYAEWSAVVARTERRSHITRYAAAWVLCATLMGLAAVLMMRAPQAPIAVVAKSHGAFELSRADGPWESFPARSSLFAGTRLRTGYSAHAALEMAGVSVRLDADTRVALRAPDRILLERGAVYIDSGSSIAPSYSKTDALIVDTPFGPVRHVGTQYEVRLVEDRMEVSVREGRVHIEYGAEQYEAERGQRLVLHSSGLADRSLIAPQDEQWQWAVTIGPAFDIQRQPLSRFLEWTAREMGKTLEYESADIRDQANRIMLRGSVSDLTPQQALAAVLATTPFQQQQTATVIRIRR